MTRFKPSDPSTIAGRYPIVDGIGRAIPRARLRELGDIAAAIADIVASGEVSLVEGVTLASILDASRTGQIGANVLGAARNLGDTESIFGALDALLTDADAATSFIPNPAFADPSGSIVDMLLGALGDRRGLVSEDPPRTPPNSSLAPPTPDPHPRDPGHDPPQSPPDPIPAPPRGEHSDPGRAPDHGEGQFQGDLDRLNNDIPLPPPRHPGNTREPGDPDAGPAGSAALAWALVPAWMRAQEQARHRQRTSGGPGGFQTQDWGRSSRSGSRFEYHGPSFVDAPARPDAATRAQVLAQARAIRAGVNPGPRPPAAASALATSAVMQALAARGVRF